MITKSEHLVDLIFNKLKTYKRKKIFLEREISILMMIEVFKSLVSIEMIKNMS